MKPESPEEIKQERDALLSIVKTSQDRAKELEAVINLLLVSGHVKKERVDQAMALAKGAE